MSGQECIGREGALTIGRIPAVRFAMATGTPRAWTMLDRAANFKLLASCRLRSLPSTSSGQEAGPPGCCVDCFDFVPAGPASSEGPDGNFNVGGGLAMKAARDVRSKFPDEPRRRECACCDVWCFRFDHSWVLGKFPGSATEERVNRWDTFTRLVLSQHRVLLPLSYPERRAEENGSTKPNERNGARRAGRSMSMTRAIG